MSDSSAKRAVLLFSPFFHPEKISTGRYNTYLALALQRAGHDVAVVCSYPFYPEWIVTTDHCDAPIGIRVLRGGKHLRYPRSQVIRRLLLEIWFYFFSRKSIRKLGDRDFDLVIDIYPPNLFALAFSRRKKLHAAIVGIVHDLQGIMSMARPSLIRKLVGKLIRPMEKKALQQCDRVIFLSNSMMQFAIENYGLEERKCDVAYPFQSLPKYKNNCHKIPAALRSHENSLVYSGALGEKQAPEDLVALMDSYARRNPDYSVFMFSNGPMFDSLKEQYEASDSPVAFHDLVPDDELEGLLVSSTIQIIPQRLGISHGAFPSKLPNLIAAEVSVFGITDKDSEVEYILTQYSRGMTVNTWDRKVALAALETLADKASARVDDPDTDDIDRLLRAQFDVDHLCDQILQTIEARSASDDSPQADDVLAE